MYDQKAPFDIVRSIYNEIDPTARRLLEVANPDGFRIRRLIDVKDFPNWSINSTALLSDACRVLSLFGFSGWSTGIEGVVMLSTLLLKDERLREAVKRLKTYQVTRKARVVGVREQAKKHAKGENDGRSMRSRVEVLGKHGAVECMRLALEKYLENHRTS
jgi:2-polyprenyl-6-methoxyphenol hydroxylase-like FAD-dependent oxidoreductase